jgi:hypothetical protein
MARALEQPAVVLRIGQDDVLGPLLGHLQVVRLDGRIERHPQREVLADSRVLAGREDGRDRIAVALTEF